MTASLESLTRRLPPLSDRAPAFGALGAFLGRLLPWLAWLMPVLAVPLVATCTSRVRGGLHAARRHFDPEIIP